MTKNYEMILDVPVDNLTMTDIKNDFDPFFKEKKKMTLTSVNPQIILMAENNSQVKTFIEQSTHRFPDGIGLIKVSNWTKGILKERVAGIDVMHEALTYANDHQKKIFLFGSQPEVAKHAAENIQFDFPHLKVVGWIDGYTQMDRYDIVKQMNDSEADMIFIALGSPKQEEWLAENLPLLNATVFQTIGGSLDVISGTVKRAPEFFIQTNLEWLYRSLSNPKRVNRIFQIPIFVAKSLNWKRKNREQ